ncbi:MAG: hypothetical protein C5B52_09750 [Bacteroidetes bacterium]|nr:MAG: hypothetical protein C5B52_09750 [Bacteroidota bacterium]
MNQECLCRKIIEESKNLGRAKANRKSGIKNWFGFTGRIIPGILLIIMPKCPICFAAYFSLVSGVGISFANAKMLRIFLIIACIISICLTVAFYVRRMLRTANPISGHN